MHPCVAELAFADAGCRGSEAVLRSSVRDVTPSHKRDKVALRLLARSTSRHPIATGLHCRPLFRASFTHTSEQGMRALECGVRACLIVLTLLPLI